MARLRVLAPTPVVDAYAPAATSAAATVLIIDWNIVHGHRPSEISRVVRGLAQTSGAGEAMIEAGCWQGGSTAKFSLAAQELGYRLAVYDSFEGVEPIGPETAGETDYSGQYAVAQEIVETNVRHYGAFDVCSFHKGWFSETLSPDTVPTPLRMVYIDCDLAKGTAEVLDAVQPHVTANTLVYSQDAHIPTVKDLLAQRARVIEPVAWSTVRLTL